MNCDKIGKFIATSRKKKGLTQIELADKLNITDRAVSKWERGKGCPDISLLEDLSKILDVSIIELLKGEKKKENKSLEKEELLYSMNYAKESTKMKMYKTISNVIVTLITVIILTIVFNNLKISVFFNHHYYPNVMFIDDAGAGTVEQLFSNIEKKIELIKKDTINYSNDELNQIITIIEKDLDEELKFYNKDYYTFNDIKKIVYKKSNGVNDIMKITGYSMSYKTIALNNDIWSYVNSFYSYERELQYFVNNCYKYNYYYDYNKDESIGNQTAQYFYDKYYIYSLVLDELIKVGEVDE